MRHYSNSLRHSSIYVNKQQLVNEAYNDITRNPGDWQEYVNDIVKQHLEKLPRTELLRIAGYTED
jgi:hypothetical protein